MRVLTFGTFDLLHIGHIRILQRCAEFGRVTVGVSSDELSITKKGRAPTYSLAERIAIIRAIRHVDDAFVEWSLADKPKYLREHGADILIMGDDWAGKFDHLSEICRVVYLPRTEGVSTTDVISRISG
ncbi:adenylyltransferase/cytidyltransferase family protein [Kitasatospora sp. NPDC056138]|uniref:adenylyltransferase/cytidyltransferase family protein n=1 Tax=Kitasatospora sp. NPDC056138 TaxID=3345724 RepID=UPI0035DF41ED